MPSQLESLKKSLARIEAERGPDAPSLKHLRAQIAMYEKPRAENPVSVYSAGSRGPKTPPPAKG